LCRPEASLHCLAGTQILDIRQREGLFKDVTCFVEKVPESLFTDEVEACTRIPPEVLDIIVSHVAWLEIPKKATTPWRSSFLICVPAIRDIASSPASWTAGRRYLASSRNVSDRVIEFPSPHPLPCGVPDSA
jgi:hypothetical protein